MKSQKIKFDKKQFLKSFQYGFFSFHHPITDISEVSIFLIAEHLKSNIQVFYRKNDIFEGEQINLQFNNYKHLLDFITANYEITED